MAGGSVRLAHARPPSGRGRINEPLPARSRPFPAAQNLSLGLRYLLLTHGFVEMPCRLLPAGPHLLPIRMHKNGPMSYLLHLLQTNSGPPPLALFRTIQDCPKDRPLPCVLG